MNFEDTFITYQRSINDIVSGDKDIWAAAAKGEKDAAVMMANDSDKSVPIVCDFQGRTASVCRITDKDRTDEPVTLPTELPPRSLVLAIIGLPAE